jgi:hypothetical protein
MFLINHLKFLWNGGLNLSTSDPVMLRECRTLSTTVFFVLPVAIGLIVSNYYTDGEHDNIFIAIATVVVFFSLYLQAISPGRTARRLAESHVVESFRACLIFSILC